MPQHDGRWVSAARHLELYEQYLVDHTPRLERVNGEGRDEYREHLASRGITYDPWDFETWSAFSRERGYRLPDFGNHYPPTSHLPDEDE